jgi:plasmid stabilization system protein ParE
VNALFQLTPQAIEDLDGIWWTIAEDSRDAAERVEMEILATCHRLAKHPRMGRKRQDVTMLVARRPQGLQSNCRVGRIVRFRDQSQPVLMVPAPRECSDSGHESSQRTSGILRLWLRRVSRGVIFRVAD